MEIKSSDSPLALSQLLQKAANNTTEGITISSLSGPDRPLVFVNEGFERMTGYQASEALGRNCRFLQGKDTDQSTVDVIRKALKTGTGCTVELLNYRKDGTRFWNRLTITPVKDHTGKVTHYVGIQSDITELRETRHSLETANARLEAFRLGITQELEKARAAQEFLLPAQLPNTPYVRFGAKFVPMEQVGGDFYDVIKTSDDTYGILIADVTGHGIPAALLTFMSSTTFKNIVQLPMTPREVMSATNDRLYSKMPLDSFVTMFYGSYNVRTCEFTYTQAGHPKGILMKAHPKEIEYLATNDPLVGIFAPDEAVFREKTVKLEPGDRIILYTDAIVETLERFSRDTSPVQLTRLLETNWDLPFTDLFEKIYQSGLETVGRENYDDDCTLVGFEVLASKTS